MAKSLFETKDTSSLTPELIMQSLFTFRDKAHKFHLNCFVKGVGSHAEHLALDDLYKGIQKKQDLILEQMMGYLMAPINASSTKTESPRYTGTSDSVILCNEIVSFATDLIEYAKINKMPNIENIGQDLSGLAAHTRYFLMFK